jgi:GT2 family glycosyltransferase
MPTTLIILPEAVKKESYVEEHVKGIRHYFGEESQIFYYNYSNAPDLKKKLIEIFYEYIIICFPSLGNIFDKLQMVKSLSIKSKVIIYCPDMDYIRMVDDVARDNDKNDLILWYSSGRSIQLNIYRQADLIIASSENDRNLLKTALNSQPVIDLSELKNTGIPDLPKNRKRVSIIVLTFNQYKLTKQFIESLKKHTPEEYELIFVDNGSKDKTKEYLDEFRANNTNVKLIFNNSNLGFAKANNQGIRVATGEYVILLNNDVILTDNWLERMIACAQSSPQIGVVGPSTNNATGQQVINYKIGLNESEIQKFAYLHAMKEAGNWFEVHRVIGFCMLIKKEVIDKIGMLDERFGPGGFEDYDFCLRVKQAGYKIMVASDIYIYHIGGKGYSDNNLDYDKLRQKNVSIFIEKWVKKTLENMEKIPENP